MMVTTGVHGLAEIIREKDEISRELATEKNYNRNIV